MKCILGALKVREKEKRENAKLVSFPGNSNKSSILGPLLGPENHPGNIKTMRAAANSIRESICTREKCSAEIYRELLGGASSWPLGSLTPYHRYPSAICWLQNRVRKRGGSNLRHWCVFELKLSCQFETEGENKKKIGARLIRFASQKNETNEHISGS